MKQFRVLPTDPRFLSLTEEQLDWMYMNMLIDSGHFDKDGNPNPKQSKEIIDKEFDTPEGAPTKEYYDPEFDALWQEIEEEHNRIVGEGVEDVYSEDLPYSDDNPDIKGEEWEEV